MLLSTPSQAAHCREVHQMRPPANAMKHSPETTDMVRISAMTVGVREAWTEVRGREMMKAVKSRGDVWTKGLGAKHDVRLLS